MITGGQRAGKVRGPRAASLPAQAIGFVPWSGRAVIVDWRARAAGTVDGRPCTVSLADVVQSDGVRSWRVRRYDFTDGAGDLPTWAVWREGRWVRMPNPSYTGRG